MSCIEGNASSEKRLYWDIKLDQDLLETIVNIYPEWFKENTLATMTEDSDPTFVPISEPMESDAGSPPVDNRSLKNTMDKNKESLKVKLMLRRPINQLIDQGILPCEWLSLSFPLLTNCSISPLKSSSDISWLSSAEAEVRACKDRWPLEA